MFCPVCNGIQSLVDNCSYCEGTVTDCGRSSDFAGPYAPYGQIEYEQHLNVSEIQNHFVCRHLLFCPSCGRITEAAVSELE